jgi:Ca2+-transporting ATPase
LDLKRKPMDEPAQGTWYSIDITEVAKALDTNIKSGLTEDEARRRLVEDGPNTLPEGTKVTLLQRILAQLNDFLVFILIGACIISISLGEMVDGLVILAIIIANAIIGVVQESKADKALDSLKEMSAPSATVIRGGVKEKIPSHDLVRGDTVLLEAGDMIPADIRLMEAVNLKVDESALTGESVPVEKDSEAILDPNTPLGDRINSAFMGTIVTYGRGRGIVISTGLDTQMGAIARAIRTYEEGKTPLQKKLDDMEKKLGLGILIICGLLFATGLLRGKPAFETFMIAISLAVAAIPEGLPAVVTLVLALGMQRMAQKHVIIRKLLAVETLGTTTVICSDKTGTLTQNQMTVVQIFTNGRLLQVTGTGYEPEGKFLLEGTTPSGATSDQLTGLLKSATLCNDASMTKKEDGTWGILGDPTEGSLIVAAAKADLEKSIIDEASPRLKEIPFDADRKLMTTIHKGPEGYIANIKGAPDITLARCTHILKDNQVLPLSEDEKDEIMKINNQMSANALRVLAIAQRNLQDLPDELTPEDIENHLIFVGLMGMIDPPRKEVIDAIAQCRRAGITPKMITGDHRVTAVAIANSLGISQNQVALTGEELEAMSDEELASKVQEVNVYARVSPVHKVRIVEALKKHGHITAMTGDGVNDALALKRADIGVAMGITGTDVAKGTADMILTDDNFTSIVSAVEEGRIIYSNIRKFVYFLLSCNIGEILIIFLATIAGGPSPLTPLQILWVNLITDAFPALALGMEKGEPHIMNIPPRDPKEPILNRDMLLGIGIQSIVITIATLFNFSHGMRIGGLEGGRTMAFTTLVLAELFRAHTSRSERYSLFSMGLFTNKAMVGATVLSLSALLIVMYVPALSAIFQLMPLGLKNWAWVLSLALLPFVAAEVNKAILRASHTMEESR